YNDSVFVQFSGSVDQNNNALWRIGTTDATVVNLEDCSGCGLSGWGWQDNGWGVGVMGPLVYFASDGQQTIRVQAREDGFSIDQIVLSPSTYISASPGTLTNDKVILPQAGAPPAPAPAPQGVLSNVVIWAADVSGGSIFGNWEKASNSTAA